MSSEKNSQAYNSNKIKSVFSSIPPIYNNQNPPQQFNDQRIFNNCDCNSEINNDKKNNIINDDMEEIDETSEYNSEDEYDELDIDIKTIDDLIKLGEDYIKEMQTLQKNKNWTTIESKRDQIKKLEKEIKEIEGYDPNTNIKTKERKHFIIDGKKCMVNLEILSKLVEPLTKLKRMIGLDSVKSAVVDMVLYYLQGFESKNNSMLHTVIEGPPGVGKTQLGKIIAKIYAGLGVITSDKFKLARRSDLIGEYTGQTAIKTQNVIDEADGGVLFIDEAYALGHEEMKESFSKECIDTINQNLSENKRKFICIIAGYPDELEKCFFSSNPGLKRRFPFKFKIDGYTPNELKDIFVKKINDIKWKLDIEIQVLNKENQENKENEEIPVRVSNEKEHMDSNEMHVKAKKLFEKIIIKKEVSNDVLTEFFKINFKEFKFFGGDVDNLLLNCKFTHSRRVFGKHPKNRRRLTLKDIEVGFDRFVSNKKKNEDQMSEHAKSMFG